MKYYCGVRRAETPMRIEAQEILQRDSFLCLGSIINKDGHIDEEVEDWIRTRRLKWRFASRALCEW